MERKETEYWFYTSSRGVLLLISITYLGQIVNDIAVVKGYSKIILKLLKGKK